MTFSEPHHEKVCFMSYANNKGADQPVHLHSLTSAFVVRCLDSKIPKVAKSNISRLYLASVTEQTGLSLTLKDRFSRDMAPLI